MAARANNLRAAKQRRQKLFIAIGGIVLLALLAFQVPRTLAMLRGPETPASAPSAAPAGAPAAPTPAAAAARAVPVALPDTDAAVAADDGQLTSFSRFESKNPFVQQVKDETLELAQQPTGAQPQPAASPAATSPPRPARARSVARTRPSARVAPSRRPTRSRPAQAPPPATTRGATPATPKPAPPKPTSAVISVNGARETVSLSKEFPQTAPMFVLVSLTRTKAEIAIAGGSLASGKDTITLEKGKAIVLTNTADGTQFELQLHSVS